MMIKRELKGKGLHREKHSDKGEKDACDKDLEWKRFGELKIGR